MSATPSCPRRRAPVQGCGSRRDDDWLSGGPGRDTLTGGVGKDTFVLGHGDSYLFASGSNGGLATESAKRKLSPATITDFSVADDTIALTATAFTGLAAGGLPASALRIVGAPSSTAATAHTRLTYSTDTGALAYDADGSGAAPTVKIAQLASGLSLTASDFTVL